MSTPFYVSPEQLMKDKSDYARKGIARGRSVLTLAYADGILFVGENPSNALHKISEIYDRIAFAAVGKYNEFENLRLAGRPLRRPARLPVRPPRRHQPRAGQRLRPDARHDLHRVGQALRGRARRRRGRRHARRRPALPADLRRLGRRGARLRRHGRQQRAAGDLRPRAARPHGARCEQVLRLGGRGAGADRPRRRAAHHLRRRPRGRGPGPHPTATGVLAPRRPPPERLLGRRPPHRETAPPAASPSPLPRARRDRAALSAGTDDRDPGPAGAGRVHCPTPGHRAGPAAARLDDRPRQTKPVVVPDGDAPSELQYSDIVVGDGDRPCTGDMPSR